MVSSLVDLFNLCQLHISYTKYVKLFLRSLTKEKLYHYLPGDMEGGGIMKNVTNGDLGGRGLKFGIFSVK